MNSCSVALRIQQLYLAVLKFCLTLLQISQPLLLFHGAAKNTGLHSNGDTSQGSLACKPEHFASL